MSGASEAEADLAERLEGVLEELTDMALDALRLASAGDPDSAETGRPWRGNDGSSRPGGRSSGVSRRCAKVPGRAANRSTTAPDAGDPGSDADVRGRLAR